MVGATPVGENAELEIIRDGKTKTVTVEIGELPAESAQEADTGQPAPKESGELVLGMQLENLGDDEKKNLELDHGVKVSEVKDGPGRQAGIQPGDILLQIQGTRVDDVDQVRELVGKLPADKSVPVLVKRDSRSLFLALKNGAAAD
jgi:serine protease Do